MKLNDRKTIILNIFIIIKIVGALALFIFGMKMMSEGIQRAAGTQIRRVLRSITSKPIISIPIGFLTTSIVQSSSAVTVLIVSFVNAGLISLRQSVGLIMGANIGTTITTWIVAIVGYHLSLDSFSLPIFALGVPLVFRNKQTKYWGEFLIGLGILIISLAFLKNAIPDIDNNADVFRIINNLGKAGIFSSILFVFIGAILSIITLSSSAAIVLILTMCAKGYVPFELALFLVLGTNIGTCLTAEVAAWVGNIDAKRTARVHTLFNTLGAIYMILLMPVFVEFIEFVLEFLGIYTPVKNNKNAMNYGLAIFHTSFNFFNTLVFIPLMGILVKLAIRTVSVSTRERDLIRNGYINSSIKTPELSIIELRNNTAKYAEILSRMLGFNTDLFNTFNNKEQNKIYDRIKKYNGISDKIYFEINEFLSTAFEEEISSNTSQFLRILYNVNRELNLLGGTYTDIANELERKRTKKIWVSPNQRNYVNEYAAGVNELAEKVRGLLRQENVSADDISDAYTIHERLSVQKDVLLRRYKNENEEIENINGAVVYENLLGLYFKVCNHYKAIIFQLSQTS